MGKVTVPAEETGTFTLNFSFENGVGVEMRLTYPKDQAISAIHAINQAAEAKYLQGLLYELRNDPSVAKQLSNAGLAFDDDDDYYDDEEWDD